MASPLRPSWYSRLFQTESVNRRPRQGSKYRPVLEALENRITPVTGVTPLPALPGGVNDLVANLIGGSGNVQISNIRYTGQAVAAGIFTGGASSIGLESGVVLSSGSAVSVIGPNTSSSTTTDHLGAVRAPGDPDLDDIAAPQTTEDAAVLEFDFVPNGNIVVFRYIFGSEEYNEFAPPNSSTFNDVFAFFLDGINVSLIPGTGQAVSINNINAVTNTQFYVNNQPPTRNTQIDGFTTILPVVLPVKQGMTHHVKLAVADVGDDAFDSVVFIESGSFDVRLVKAFHPVRYQYNRATGMYEGDITITNFTNLGLPGPLFVLLTNLPPGVVVTNAQTTAAGTPYLSLPGDGSLAASSSVRLPIVVQNLTRQHISTFFIGFGIQITPFLDEDFLGDPSGYVYQDADRNGVRDSGELGIADVIIYLTGVTDDGRQISDMTTTDENGYYQFLVVPGTYALTQVQPAGFRDGLESLGSLGGLVGNDQFTNIVVRTGDLGVDYNFGEWINQAPVLLVNDRSVHANESLTVPVTVQNPDNDPLTVRANLADRSDLAYELKYTLGLKPARNYPVNRLRLGYQEKWLKGSNRKRYLLLPSGDFYLYSGRRGPLSTHTWIARLTPAYYENVNLLTVPAEPLARISMIGEQLTITPRARYTGNLSVEVTASDGLASDEKTFNVAVTNTAATVAAIAHQEMIAGTTLTIELAVSDGDGDALNFQAVLSGGERLAYEMKQALGLIPTTNYRVNRLRYGYQEKWLTGANRQRYFILPSGDVYRYGGRRGPLSTHQFVGTLSPEFYENPQLFWGAAEPTVALSFAGNQLLIKPQAGYTGTVTVEVRVDDGTEIVTRSFTVTIKGPGTP